MKVKERIWRLGKDMKEMKNKERIWRIRKGYDG